MTNEELGESIERVRASRKPDSLRITIRAADADALLDAAARCAAAERERDEARATLAALSAPATQPSDEVREALREILRQPFVPISGGVRADIPISLISRARAALGLPHA